MLDQSYALILAGFPKKRQRELLGLTVCGSVCSECSCYGSLCAGCNESGGKVFHAPAGKPCPIYACCVNKRRYATCKDCADLPCGLWRATRDPSVSDAAFEADIQQRVSALRGGVCPAESASE